LCLCLAACAADASNPDASMTLRIGSHQGLARMKSTVSETMTVNLVELVYGALSEYFDRIEVVGPTVRLHVKSGSSLDAQQLARLVEHPAVDQRSSEPEFVVLHFDSVAAAAEIALDSTLLPIGAYRALESPENTVLLERRVANEGPNLIQVINVPSEEEEWRRFIAGGLDLLPYLQLNAVRYLSQIPSVRVVPFSTHQSAGLWFRVDRGPAMDVRIRRAISLAVRRRALADSVTQDPEDALPVAEDVEAAQALLQDVGISVAQPLYLRMLVYAGQPDFVRAALVLQQQLAVVGVVLRVEAVEVEVLKQRLAQRDFDTLLFRGDTSARSWMYLSRGSPGNFSGYDSDDFEAARNAGDEAAGRAILDRDVPVTPLFVIRDAVAVRAGYCGVHPATSTEYTWLALVHACKPGEEN
jgi:hypothetical protein